MQWISYKENPPQDDCVCLVHNNKGWMMNETAIYHKKHDVFVLSDGSRVSSILLEVTHYLPIPNFPKKA